MIIELRRTLTAQGLDAGGETIAWHLQQHHGEVISTSTIRRHLISAGLITPAPRKRPRTSYIRFQADLPNEMWQTDMTHIRLADGTDTEVLTWLDDHSRYALDVTAFVVVNSRAVVASFRETAGQHGHPAPANSSATSNSTPPAPTNPPENRKTLEPEGSRVSDVSRHHMVDVLALLANQNLQLVLEEISIRPVEIEDAFAPLRTRQKQRRLSPREISELHAAYLSGASVPTLAVNLGIHRTTVLAHLERAGIPRRPNTRLLTDQQVKKAAHLYAQGNSLDTVAVCFGVSQRTITRELRNAGASIRPSRRDGAP